MNRFMVGTRYIIAFPIFGLVIASTVFFVVGGYGLIRLMVESLLSVLGFVVVAVPPDRGLVIFEVVEYVHTFLVGTVLYITAVGLYQLFIKEISFPGWLKIESVEELETDLIGVTVVVLAVNFMGAILVNSQENMLQFGGGIALVIASLGLFVGLRAWSVKLNRGTVSHGKPADSDAGGNDPLH